MNEASVMLAFCAEITPADFIKCAGEGKPHFIKCGFGDVCHFEMVEVA